MEQRRLAAAGAAEDGHDLVCVDRQADPVQKAARRTAGTDALGQIRG
jgi:hypothetical protein